MTIDKRFKIKIYQRKTRSYENPIMKWKVDNISKTTVYM